MSSRIEELMKGCGAWTKGKMKGLPFETQCGNEGFKDAVCLCEVCRARIDERERMEKEVRDILNNWRITNGLYVEGCYNKDKPRSINYAMIRDLLKELKLSEEKTK